MAVLRQGPATGLDIEAYRGDTFAAYLQIKRNGVPENLTDSFFDMQIRNGSAIINNISSLEATVQGGIVMDELKGLIYIIISPERMSELLPGSYTYDLQQSKTNALVKTRIRGSFTIIDDVTKPIS